MRHTLKHCQAVLKDHIIAAHFFNARGDSLERTPLGMLRSLSYQLLDKEPSIYERFIHIFREKQRMHRVGEWKWRESELKQFLLSEIPMFQKKPLLLLVDALDECSESHVRDVMEFLETLSIEAVCTGATLNIYLSSRHYPHIIMKKCQELVVETRTEHAEDIAKYVCDRLTKRDEVIENAVIQKASGNFMWVVLVVAMLNKAYDEGRYQMLLEVPGDLEEMIANLLSKDKRDEHETILMLQCVLVARRPLKPEELYFAMISGTNAGNLGDWNLSKITGDDIRRRITSSSRGLIEVRRGQKRRRTSSTSLSSPSSFEIRGCKTWTRLSSQAPLG